MKKILALCLVAALALSVFAGCGGQPAGGTEPPETTAPAPSGSLKILAIGNSFSQDAMQMLYEIAIQEGYTEVVLGNLYDAGCTLEEHVQNIEQSKTAYNFWYNSLGGWETRAAHTLLGGLQAEEWDIITLQQGSPASGVIDTYNEDIQTIVDYVNQNKTNPNAKMYWHMTWAYAKDSSQDVFYNVYKLDQMNMYNMIVDCVKQKVVPNTAFTDVIPCGTAIQNARTSYLGDTMNRDGYHLSDMGRIIAGYTYFCLLTGKTLDTIALKEVPSKLLKSTEVMGNLYLTEGQRLVIAESVKNAIANPYTVTQSQYTTEPGK